MNATWHVSYTAGPVSFGYQTGGADNALAGAARTTRTAGAELLLSCTQLQMVYLNMRKCQSLQT